STFISIQPMKGAISIQASDNGFAPFGVKKWEFIYGLPTSITSVGHGPFWLPHYRRFDKWTFPDTFELLIPIWLMILPFGIPFTWPWVHLRFSIRTLLNATTLVAIV